MVTYFSWLDLSISRLRLDYVRKSLKSKVIHHFIHYDTSAFQYIQANLCQRSQKHVRTKRTKKESYKFDCSLLIFGLFSFGHSRTSTARYLILPSLNLPMASSIPSFVIGNFSIVGVIRFRLANSSNSSRSCRDATKLPWIRTPRSLSWIRGTRVSSSDTVKG